MFIKVIVRPAAKKSSLIRKEERSFEIKVKEPARQGRANQAVISALAEYFNLPRSRLRIVAGRRSRRKLIRVDKIGER